MRPPVNSRGSILYMTIDQQPFVVSSLVERNNIPRTIGIIMDGNRRWAKAHGLPAAEGHRRGYEKLKEVARWCGEAGVEYLVVYAFSTENWSRTKEEVGYLMGLFKLALREMLAEAKKENMRVRVIGDRDKLDDELRTAILKMETETAGCTGLTLVLALNYGGRAEIIDAIRRIPAEKARTVTEEEFGRLETCRIPISFSARAERRDSPGFFHGSRSTANSFLQKPSGPISRKTNSIAY